MPGSTPPFRADQVGSLLRPQPLKEAREKRAKGEIDADALRAVEDEEIRKVIKKQESIGLKAVTDGEFRRAFWHLDFLERLGGVESYEGERQVMFKGVQPKPVLLRTIGKVGPTLDHPMIDHFRFVKDNTSVTPKMTIPSPTSLHFRYGRPAIDAGVYPDLDQFFEDLGAAYAAMVQAFYDAGCRYLQLDEVNMAYLCDPDQREGVRSRGADPDTLPATYAKLMDAAIKNRPDDMVVTTHLCRGNFRSTFVASGGYEPVAEILLNDISLDGYFMEYDSDRAGGFEPLRFTPKGKTIVLGLVTSKTGDMESKDAIKKRIEEATKFIPLDQLALSPQCGFSSTEEGNVLTEDDQWRKLEMIVEVANDVWGGL
jgi:5-methyltetrahydropteroyltriglutamate--homocysteine methyltransferase